MDTVFYANSHCQLLSAHSVLVARVARALGTQSYPNGQGEADALSTSIIGRLAYWAGLLHDIGKLDPYFQNYIQGLIAQRDDKPSTVNDAWSVEDGVQIVPSASVPAESKGGLGHPRHQEVSWWLFRLLCTSDAFRQAIGAQSQDNTRIDYVAYAIYWHHAKPLRSEVERQHWSQATSIVRALQEHGWDIELNRPEFRR